MPAFEKAFAIVIGEEGGYTTDPRDPGNWTGGAAGVGVCAGTKYGVSAKTYPNVDIRNLTLAQAQEIYRRDFWSRIHGDDLPPGLALLAFDALINGGHPAQWIQAAVGVVQDGNVGPVTLAAARAAFAKPDRGAAAITEFQAQRLAYLTGLAGWTTYGAHGGQPKGWARRVCSLIPEALSITD